MADSGSELSLAEVESERQAAIRNLKRLQKSDPRVQPNEMFVGRYLALRKLKGTQCRITAAVLLDLDTKESVTHTLTQTFWVLPKSRRPKLDSEIERKFFIDPKLMESLPKGFAADEIWVLDRAITQSELGVGAFAWATVSSAISVYLGDDCLAIHGNESGPAVELENRPEQKPAEDTFSSCGFSSQGSSDFSRLLSSDHLEKVSREDIFEDIAKETKSAMDGCRYYSEHMQDASTIEFWLRAYVSHIYKLHADHKAGPSSESAFVDTLPDYVKRYVGFVIQCLLASPCRFVLEKFTFQFDQLEEICPELVPPMARALDMLTGDIVFATMNVCTYNVMLLLARH